MGSTVKYIYNWIEQNTKDCQSVVEFGAGKFDKLIHCHSSVTHRIGIELWESDILEAFKKYKNSLIYIKGDMQNFLKIINPKYFDCALFVDSLEHLVKKDAEKLIKSVQEHFRKILLMIPEGNHPQIGDRPFQKHLSTWSVKDIIKLNFVKEKVNLISNFHDFNDKDNGCIFAEWTK